MESATIASQLGTGGGVAPWAQESHALPAHMLRDCIGGALSSGQLATRRGLGVKKRGARAPGCSSVTAFVVMLTIPSESRTLTVTLGALGGRTVQGRKERVASLPSYR